MKLLKERTVMMDFLSSQKLLAAVLLEEKSTMQKLACDTYEKSPQLQFQNWNSVQVNGVRILSKESMLLLSNYLKQAKYLKVMFESRRT